MKYRMKQKVWLKQHFYDNQWKKNYAKGIIAWIDLRDINMVLAYFNNSSFFNSPRKVYYKVLAINPVTKRTLVEWWPEEKISKTKPK